MIDLFEYKKYIDGPEEFSTELEKEFSFFISYYRNMIGFLQVFAETLTDYEADPDKNDQLTLDSITNSLARKVRRIRSVRSMINPHIYVTEFKERNGEKCLIGKVNIFPLDGDKKKLISIYLGKADIIGDKGSSIVMAIARVKVIAKMKEMITE